MDRVRAARLALAGLLVLGALGAGACSGDGDGDDAGGDSPAADGTTTTSLETGGIEVDVPQGWRAVPLPQLGFGVGIPGDWEAAVLTGDVLADLASASPAVPGFLDAAHAAADSGSVFYAAGSDDQGRVTDLKVRAAPDSAVTDVAGLEAYARQIAADEGMPDPEVVVPEGAARPTVELRYRTTAQRPSLDTPDTGATAPEDPEDPELVDVTVRGTERLVLGPRGVVYSLIVTSEDAADHDTVADRILGTLTFPG
jgi:hypothetical protein